jgi:GH15 family glucan-1,4-alpha-glucosidase
MTRLTLPPCRYIPSTCLLSWTATPRLSRRTVSIGTSIDVTENTIGDYAAIGDGRSAALVGKDGSIDWLCWPRFDSPSIFGALLDPTAGRWRIAPVAPFRTERHYIKDTNVLQTRFDTGAGLLVLTDLMPVASEEEKASLLMPEREILRLIECERGEVEIEWSFEPRPGYGLRPVSIRQAGQLGIRAQTEAATGKPRGCCSPGASTSVAIGTSRTKASGSHGPAV